MPYIGYCNCARVQISLAEQPANSVLCHCSNCKRAGGGQFSVNFFIEFDKISIEDPTDCLRVYEDMKTTSGNMVKRNFCRSCGSPVFTESPSIPGKVFLKASLFDDVPPPGGQFFSENGADWLQVQQAQ